MDSPASTPMIHHHLVDGPPPLHHHHPDHPSSTTMLNGPLPSRPRSSLGLPPTPMTSSSPTRPQSSAGILHGPNANLHPGPFASLPSRPLLSPLHAHSAHHVPHLLASSPLRPSLSSPGAIGGPPAGVGAPPSSGPARVPSTDALFASLYGSAPGSGPTPPGSIVHPSHGVASYATVQPPVGPAYPPFPTAHFLPSPQPPTNYGWPTPTSVGVPNGPVVAHHAHLLGHAHSPYGFPVGGGPVVGSADASPVPPSSSAHHFNHLHPAGSSSPSALGLIGMAKSPSVVQSGLVSPAIGSAASSRPSSAVIPHHAQPGGAAATSAGQGMWIISQKTLDQLEHAREEATYECEFCEKVYSGKHARSIWRRHLSDKHEIPLSSQPRRTRWDNADANRPKSEAERRERTLESKRRWARKNRAEKKAIRDAGLPVPKSARAISAAAAAIGFIATSADCGSDSSDYDDDDDDARTGGTKSQGGPSSDAGAVDWDLEDGDESGKQGRRKRRLQEPMMSGGRLRSKDGRFLAVPAGGVGMVKSSSTVEQMTAAFTSTPHLARTHSAPLPIHQHRSMTQYPGASSAAGLLSPNVYAATSAGLSTAPTSISGDLEREGYFANAALDPSLASHATPEPTSKRARVLAKKSAIEDEDEDDEDRDVPARKVHEASDALTALRNSAARPSREAWNDVKEEYEVPLRKAGSIGGSSDVSSVTGGRKVKSSSSSSTQHKKRNSVGSAGVLVQKKLQPQDESAATLSDEGISFASSSNASSNLGNSLLGKRSAESDDGSSPFTSPEGASKTDGASTVEKRQAKRQRSLDTPSKVAGEDEAEEVGEDAASSSFGEYDNFFESFEQQTPARPTSSAALSRPSRPKASTAGGAAAKLEGQKDATDEEDADMADAMPFESSPDVPRVGPGSDGSDDEAGRRSVFHYGPVSVDVRGGDKAAAAAAAGKASRLPPLLMHEHGDPSSSAASSGSWAALQTPAGFSRTSTHVFGGHLSVGNGLGLSLNGAKGHQASSPSGGPGGGLFSSPAHANLSRSLGLVPSGPSFGGMDDLMSLSLCATPWDSKKERR